MKKKKNTQKPGKYDYSTYTYTRQEKIKYFLMGICLSGIVGILFYKSVWAVILYLPFGFIFLEYKRRILCEKRKWEFNQQFRQGILCLSSALNAGYSIENAFLEASSDLELMYTKEEDIIREFRWMNQQLALNKNVEEVLLELAERTKVEDVESFAEIVKTAKRTGGDLIKVIKQTEKNIGEKIEVQRELETLISAKKLETNIMSVVPLGIIGYLWLSSPGFLDCLYHNLLGCIIMTVILIVYIIVYLVGRKITDIKL